MNIEYVAFDSFGIKSMCTSIGTKDCNITIDPGIAWETNSFPLPIVEKGILEQVYTRKIKRACKKSDLIVITHYHYDHYIPEPSLYAKKTLIVKDPYNNINSSQKKRAAEFLPQVNAKVMVADGETFKFGKTTVKCSKALWHGAEKTPLGFVIMVAIDDREEKIVYTSDLNGIHIKKYVELIAEENPDVIIFDGAPTYLLGYVMSFKSLKLCIKNTISLLEKTDAGLYIIDHHLLRDYRYKELYYEVFKRAEELEKKILTAAEVTGKKPKVIEAYEKYGPTRWKKWRKLTWKEFRKIESAPTLKKSYL